jgi:F0F1-type ATP synthase membrane subunit b/b'
MAKDLFWTTATFAIVLTVLILAFWPTNRGHVTVAYDCRIAEISPDYPVAVKEECRKRNQQ